MTAQRLTSVEQALCPSLPAASIACCSCYTSCLTACACLCCAVPPCLSVLRGVLDQHNQYRARHGVPALSWSTSIASQAQSYSQRCIFQHSKSGLGENLAKGHRSFSVAVSDWYSEGASYNYGGSMGSAGHFTAMVSRMHRHH